MQDAVDWMEDRNDEELMMEQKVSQTKVLNTLTINIFVPVPALTILSILFLDIDFIWADMLNFNYGRCVNYTQIWAANKIKLYIVAK